MFIAGISAETALIQSWTKFSEKQGEGGSQLAKGKKVLITGGAGFVGSHTADALLRHGHSVRIYDNLNEQVHGAGMPAHVSRD